jgi:hypothetical protein
MMNEAAQYNRIFVASSLLIFIILNVLILIIYSPFSITPYFYFVVSRFRSMFDFIASLF